MDNDKLSKQKYVYRVYLAQCEPDYADTLHIERYPVIYVNEWIAYIKDGRKQRRLTEVPTHRIGDHFNLTEAQKLIQNRTLDRYYWQADDITEHLEALRVFKRSVDQKKYREVVEKRLNAAKSELEKAQAMFDKLAKETEDKSDGVV